MGRRQGVGWSIGCSRFVLYRDNEDNFVAEDIHPLSPLLVLLYSMTGPRSLSESSGSGAGGSRYLLSKGAWLVGIVSSVGVAEVYSAALGSFDGAIEGLRKIAGLFSILAGFMGDFSVSTGRSIKLVTGLGW